MQWSDLWIAGAGTKVAHRLESVGDLRAFVGQIAVGADGEALPALAAREGVWVSTEPMPETVKDVGDDGLVRATVPRDGLSIVCFPVVLPASIAYDAGDPAALLRKVLASGSQLNRL